MKIVNFVMGILLVFSSCKTIKKTTDSNKNIKAISSKRIAKKHKNAHFEGKTIEVKYKVVYDDGSKKQSFTLQLKLIKDKTIWVKGSKFITIFKAKMTPETLAYYSSLFKNYFQGDYQVIQNILGAEIRFEELQNLLLGQSITNMRKDVVEVTVQQNTYVVALLNKFNNFDVRYRVHPSHFKLNSQSLFNELKKQRLDVNYLAYTSVDDELLPATIEIVAKQQKQVKKIRLTVKSIEINTPTNISFSIPKGYKKVSL